MGMILQFRQSENIGNAAEDLRESVQGQKGSSAEIIIFPGVRIERQAEPEEPEVAPKRRKRSKRTARRKV